MLMLVLILILLIILLIKLISSLRLSSDVVRTPRSRHAQKPACVFGKPLVEVEQILIIQLLLIIILLLVSLLALLLLLTFITYYYCLLSLLSYSNSFGRHMSNRCARLSVSGKSASRKSAADRQDDTRKARIEQFEGSTHTFVF